MRIPLAARPLLWPTLLFGALLSGAAAPANASTVVFSGTGQGGATLSGSAVLEPGLNVVPTAFSALFDGLGAGFGSPTETFGLPEFPTLIFVDDPTSPTITFSASRPGDAGSVSSCGFSCLSLFIGTGVNQFTTRVESVTASVVPEPASLAVLGVALAAGLTRRRHAPQGSLVVA